MTDTDSSATPSQPKPLRLARLGWLLVLIFLLGGVAYLSIRAMLDHQPQITVLVPDKNISPYQRIASGDLRSIRIDAQSGRDFQRDRRRIAGHYSLTTLAVGEPIPIEATGPKAPDDLNRSFVFSIEGGASVSLGGQLSRGSRVDVLLPGKPAPTRLEALFVLDVRPITKDRWAVTLAISRAITDDQAAMLAEGRANLVRRPAG